MKLIAAGTLAFALAANIAQSRQALAWGDEGHEVVALIAQSFLEADVRKRVTALLSADTDDLTAHDIDSGGNAKKVSANGFKAGNLHHYWDTEFVALLETDAKSIASDLIGHISKEQQRKWQPGSPSDWAVETFEVAKADAYGQLPEH